MITSHHNPGLQLLRRLQRARERRATGLFAVEGEDLVAAAAAAGWEPEARWVAGEDVTAEALARVSVLHSGSRAAAVYRQRWAPAPTGPRCVALWGVGDPGNVGAVLRAALAFGAGSVALGPGCADPFGPKAVRASMGAVFAVGLARVDSPGELPGERIALVAGAGERLRGPGEATLLVGAERAGLPAAVVDACERTAHIPIASDSLNAAMAATVALYELTRGSSRPTGSVRGATTIEPA
jgi:TrmH family RNA methyltransferase